MLILSVFCYIIRAINYVLVVLKVMLYMSDRLIDNKELMKEWNQEKNILYNPAALTSGSSKKVWWKCKNGHEWEAVIHTRVKGVGCPYCMGKKAIQGVNDFATLYPEMLKEWDYEENDKLGIKPNKLLVGSIKKVYWICSKGHKYDRSIYDRLHGRGNCPYCGNRKVLQGYNDLATTNPELLKDWDYEENDKLGIKPNEITNGGKEKVWWKCEKGHKWNSIIRSRITGSGCPYCSNNLVKKGYNDIATTNPELLEEWDYEKNDKLGIFPSNLSHGSTKLVWWKCKKGHEYQISVAQKTNRNVNCPICANQQLLKGYNDFATKHPELLKEWNYEKNDKLDIKPDEIILGGKVKFWWKCEKGHEWQSSIPARIRNDKLYNRCPICSSYLRTSIPEKIIFYYVHKKFSKTIANYKPEWLKPKEIDIFIPELNVGIEYDGYYYHKDIKHDIEKDDLCSKNNVRIIRIREKKSKPINSSAIIYNIKIDNNTDYTYVEDALSFLNSYLNIDLDFDIRRDLDDIIKMINFMEKENCISKTNPEVLQEWNYEKNDKLGITPDNISSGSALKIWWKCEKGHEYKSSIVNRTKSKGTCCPYCSGNKVLKGFNDLATNPELLKEWDYSKNTIKPDEVTKGTHKKIWWICSNNHSYEATIPARRRGTGCPYCSGNKILVGFNDLETTNPELLEKWNYEKNNKLGITPKSISKSYSKKVWWKCKNGHEYQRHVYNERKGSGRCPICKKLKL